MDSCTKLGDSAAITLFHNANVTAPNSYDRPGFILHLHPKTQKQYQEIVAAIRNVYEELDIPLFECASFNDGSNGGLRYGVSDFYMTAKDAANNHGECIVVFWPSR